MLLSIIFMIQAISQFITENELYFSSFSFRLYWFITFIMTGLPRILDLRDYSVLIGVPMLMTALLIELPRCDLFSSIC